MRTRIAPVFARVGIATLAAVGVFAIAQGAAVAAPSQAIAVAHETSATAPTPAQCTAIRQEIHALKAQRRIAQQMLAHATPAEKPDLIAEIREINAAIAELSALLTDCTDAI